MAPQERTALLNGHTPGFDKLEKVTWFKFWTHNLNLEVKKKNSKPWR